MGVVSGVIGIKDNATAVLRNIKKEQTSFRADVESTRKELQATWDKKREAKLEATAATKKMNDLKKRLDPLRKKVVTAIAIKDMATSKVKSVASKVKSVGKMVATPVVKVAVKGGQALSAIGKGVKQAAKVAAIGIGAVAAAGAAGLTALFSGSTDAAKAQIEAETKLEAVLGNVKSLQAEGPGAVRRAKEELMGVASQLQQVGVIGDEVTLAGMQQLATFQLSDKQIATLAGGMTDLLAQQKGLNATQEDAVGIGNMIGKVMQGQTSALSRVGITFDAAQEKALKTGDATQRAAVLAEILQQNVGGVNAALAETDQGKIQQMSNAWGDMKEEVGKVALTIKGRLASVVMKNIPTIQKLGTTLMNTLSGLADRVMPVLDSVISVVTPVIDTLLGKMGSVADTLGPVFSNIFGGLASSAATVKPLLDGIVNNFKPLMPQLAKFGTSVMGTIQKVAVAVVPAVASIINTVQAVIPAVLPVLETVVTTIGTVIAAAAPVIAGLVEGIGTVVSTLAPVFNVIFGEIGAKVGSVLDFVGSKMGFIQEVIGTVAPIIADVLTTVWSVISPVMDALINVFKVVFNVVQTVWPGIQKILESVWGIIKPIIEAVGKVVGGIAGAFGWIANKLTGGGGEVGSNATGTSNWRGGPTWVGEKGPEIIDLPKGSRVTPAPESARLVNQAGKATQTPNRPSITITIPKLADQIIVREEADIDKIGESVAKKVLLALQNM